MSLSRSVNPGSAVPRNLFLVGNPGKGKSTLLNAMIGKVVFPSRFSAGTGCTFQFEKYSLDGMNWLDAPGLDDWKKREQAAAAIEEALKQDGLYTVFFVITLEAGRVNSQDATTMKIVLKACPSIGDRYGIIINKVKPKSVPKVRAQMASITSALFVDETIPATGYIFVNAEDDELEDAEDALAELSQEFRDFLDNAPKIAIQPDEVEALDVMDWDAKQREFDDAMAKLQEDNERKEERMRELEAKYEQQMTELAANNAREIQRMEQRHTDLDQQMKKMIEEEEEKRRMKLQVRSMSAYEESYSDRNTGARQDLSVWRPKLQSGEYRLMYTGTNSRAAPITETVVAISDDHLAIPEAMVCEWCDRNTGAPHDGSLWRVVAPSGYVALSDVAVHMSNDGLEPGKRVEAWRIDPDFRCVKAHLARETSQSLVWTDAGSGGCYDGACWPINNGSQGMRVSRGGGHTPIGRTYALKSDVTRET